MASALRSCRLQSLGLEKNGVRTRGCEALGLALTTSKHLSWLRLQHNRLGDEGVAALAKGLVDNASLTHLQLRDVNMGQRGVKALADGIRKHPSLRELGLEDNGLRAEDSEMLLRAATQAKLKAISLDIDHGGVCERVRTRDDLNKEITMAALFGKKKKGISTAEQMAKSYVGPLGVSSHARASSSE